MRTTGYRQLVTLRAAAILASAAGVRATEITGPHNNHMTGNLDGYDALSGAYDVPADTAGVPSATFNNNFNDGLGVGGAGTSVTIEGGQFNGNFNFGVDVGAGATLTISGGIFDNNTAAISALGPSLTTIYGGQFLDGVSLYIDGGAVVVYGGQFAGTVRQTTIDMFSGTLDLYGAFAEVADGQTLVLPKTTSNLGSFYGQLEDNSTAQAYGYTDFGGTITLHGTGTLVPEPATLGLMAFAGDVLLLRRRCGRPPK